MPDTPTRRPYGSGALLQRAGSWYGQWRVNGRLFKRKLGTIRTAGHNDGLTRSQAEAALRAAMQATRVAPPGSRVTIAELGASYVSHGESVAGLKATTLGDYRSILRRHLSPYFGSTTIERIRGADISEYVQAKRRDGLAPKTISNHLVLLHGMFAFAYRRELVATNPIDRSERPIIRRNEDIRYLTADELERLASGFPASAIGQQDRRLTLFAAMTGLRQGELLALRWSDVDTDAGVVHVRRSYTRGQTTTPKSRLAVRSVPLASAARKVLAEQREASSFQGAEALVFSHVELGSILDPSRLRRRFTDALDCAGLRRVRFHDLRHTYGTRMAAAGAPLRVLQEWMGHRDYKTTSIYAAFLPDASRDFHFAEAAFGTRSRTRTAPSQPSRRNTHAPEPRSAEPPGGS